MNMLNRQVFVGKEPSFLADNADNTSTQASASLSDS